MKRLLLLLPATILLSGCLGEFLSLFCDFGDDSDHCYQAAAVQESDPEDCAKIEGKDFGGVSNPPKDKCYLQIAGNSGDPSVCEKIEGGMMSYSEEECLAAVWKDHTPADCVNADDEAACRAAYGKHGKGCGEGFTYNAGKGTCDAVKADDGVNDDIESKVEADLNTIGDAAKGKYMELLEQAIEDEEDDAKKLGLEKYKEFLEKSGETLDTVTTTVDTLKEIKRIFVDAYDPSMNVENMPVDKILEKGLFDRMKDKLLGASEPTGVEKENADADDALAVYEAMLKRQSEIDFLKKDKLTRLSDTVVGKVKDQATDKLKESVTEIAEGVGGTAFAAVGIVGDALQSFQDEAQKQMFVGLARAYNRRRSTLESQNPGMSPEQLHTMTVAQVKEDPYRDNTNTGFVKHGNLLENGDCSDGNPLCVDPNVWWTAMDKTYRHANKAAR